MKSLNNINQHSLTKARDQFLNLKQSLIGCSYGEAKSKCKIISNVDDDIRAFDFIHGNLKGKIYENSDMVIVIVNHLQVFDEVDLEYSCYMSVQSLCE